MMRAHEVRDRFLGVGCGPCTQVEHHLGREVFAADPRREFRRPWAALAVDPASVSPDLEVYAAGDERSHTLARSEFERALFGVGPGRQAGVHRDAARSFARWRGHRTRGIRRSQQRAEWGRGAGCLGGLTLARLVFVVVFGTMRHGNVAGYTVALPGAPATSAQSGH
jgi:hypothetical protein